VTTGRHGARIRAHAKINLSLHVHGLRPDGYHELETVFQSLALHDTVTCTLTRGPFRVTCDDPAVPTDSRNLVWRAAERLWRALDRRGEMRGVDIALAKSIPSQAGLGGGSSDAAAALEALAALWSADASVDLASIAAQVGADAPYFLMGGTALGLSRGEKLYPLPELPATHVVLALQAFGVPTADAYRWFDESRRAPGRSKQAGTDGETGGLVLAAGPLNRHSGMSNWNLVVHNDLEAPVVRRHPEIGAVRDVLARSGAFAASMTGSGSAVFGLFETSAAARRAAQRVAEAGFVSMVTKTAGRRG